MAIALVQPQSTIQVGYGSGYTKPKAVAAQIKTLAALWPHTWHTKHNSWMDYPLGSEGPFVLPWWNMLVSQANALASYTLAVQKVLEKLGTQRKGGFENRCVGRSVLEHLCESAESKLICGIMCSRQMDADFLVFPAQFGARHRGKSVVKALRDMKKDGGVEVGLRTYDVGIMLLTHPERLSKDEDLGIDCPGDQCPCDKTERHPCFFVEGNKLVFDIVDSNRSHPRFGSASCWIDHPKAA